MNYQTSQEIWQIADLSMSERIVLLALEHNGDLDSFSWWSHAKLGEMTGINVESKYLTRNINQLEKDGHLMVWRQHGHKGGRGYTHIYLVVVGKKKDEILEIVMRRFMATQEEAEAIISQSGSVYEELVKRNRVSAKTLEESRGTKKGVPQNTYKEEKGVPEAPQIDKRVYQEPPKDEGENKKGVPGTPRFLESLNPKESNSKVVISPNGDSGQKPPAPAGSGKNAPLTIPAFKVFIEVTSYWKVTQYWRKRMGEVVGEKPDRLNFWHQVVEAYTGKGWFAGDVKTMLEEYFLKGILPGQDRKNGTYQNPGTPANKSSPMPVTEEYQRLLEQDKSQVFNPLA